MKAREDKEKEKESISSSHYCMQETGECGDGDNKTR